MGRFQAGQSGNPGGRPKALAEVVALARAETAANIAALVRIRDDRNSPPAAVVAASTALLNRGWGLPTQVIAGDEERPVSIAFTWAPATPADVGAEAVIDGATHADTSPLTLVWETS